MRRVHLHPLLLRIWHWANAAAVIILLVTGIQLRLAGIASLRPHDASLLVHRYAGWAMVGLWALWLAYGLARRNLNGNYRLGRGDFKGMVEQAKFYTFHIFKGERNPFRPSPEEKFNSLQKLAYGAVMFFFVPLLAVTGLPLSDALFFRKHLLLWNGAGIFNALHVAAAYVFLFYLIIHFYMATLGRTAFSHIKAMITGYEEEPDSSEAEGR